MQRVHMLGYYLVIISYSAALCLNITEREFNAQADSLHGVSRGTDRCRSVSAFPILMYDSDVGFGFGGRGVVKNRFLGDESFDLMVFASTKGEQTYQLLLSIPDPEIRQGTLYPVSIDLELAFSKLLKSNFFGFGNESEDNDWQFPRETLLLTATMGRAFSPRFISDLTIAYNHVSVYDYGSSRVMTDSIDGAGEALTASVGLGIRWDTRTSQIHPEQGWVVGIRAEFAGEMLGSDFTFQRYRFELNKYVSVHSSRHILAGRLSGQHVEGTAPYYERSIIGGGTSARGFKADRFVDSVMALASLEYRCMVRYPISTVIFVDTGRVDPEIYDMTIRGWKSSIGGGLRYHLEDFIARFDAGFSDEGTRIFFNFGHVF